MVTAQVSRYLFFRAISYEVPKVSTIETPGVLFGVDDGKCSQNSLCNTLGHCLCYSVLRRGLFDTGLDHLINSWWRVKRQCSQNHLVEVLAFSIVILISISFLASGLSNCFSSAAFIRSTNFVNDSSIPWVIVVKLCSGTV